MSFMENFKNEVEKSTLTYAEIARKMGLSKSTVWAWGNNLNRTPNPKDISTLADILGISEQDLLNPKRKIMQRIEETAILQAYEGQNEILEDIIVSTLLIKDLDPYYLRIYKVLNRTLEPKLKYDDLLIIDLIGNRENYKKINGNYLVNLEGKEAIKKVEFLPKNEVILSSLNNKTKDILPERMGYDYKILAKICGIISSQVLDF